MAILEMVQKTIKESLKAKDSVRLNAARMAQAALRNREIEKKGSLDEGEAQKVITTLAKQRRESIEQFRKGNREELAKKEEEELSFLVSLLPPQASDDEIAAVVDRIIQESEASGPSDIGKVMKPVMTELAGKADGSRVRQIVQERLGQ